MKTTIRSVVVVILAALTAPVCFPAEMCRFSCSEELQAILDGSRQVNLSQRAADIDEDMSASSTIASMFTWGIVAEEGTAAARIKGSRAENRIKSRTPVFPELAAKEGQSPHDAFALIRLTVVDNKDRFVVLGEVTDSLYDGYELRWKFKGGIRIPLKLEKVQSSCTLKDMVMNVYRGVPATPLAPGEYALLYGERFYDFGVDP